MADAKITALPAATGVTGDDLVAVVDSPGGSPVTKKATVDQVKTYMNLGTYTDHGSSGAAQTIDFSVGTHRILLTANCTISWTGATSGIPASVLIILVQNATGGFTTTFTNGKFPGGSMFLSTAINARSRCVAMTEDGGATVDITLVGNDFA